MAHEILTVKLCELEDQFARLSSRIRLTETASRSQLQQEIQALTRECAQTALTLENKLKRSRGEVAAVLADAYGKVDSVLQQARSQLRRQTAVRPGQADAAVEKKLLLAE